MTRHIEDVYSTASAILALVEMVETTFHAVDALLELAGTQRALDAEQSVDSPMGEYRSQLARSKEQLGNAGVALRHLAELRDRLEQTSAVVQRASGRPRIKSGSTNL